MTTKDNGGSWVKTYKNWKIRPRPNGTWQIDNATEHNRIRCVKPSLEAAKQEIDRLETEKENYGNKGDVLSYDLKREVAKGIDELNGNVSVSEVFKFYRQHHPVGNKSSVGQMADAWLQYSMMDGKSPVTIRQNRHRVKAFAEAVGNDTPVAEITRPQALNFIADLDVGKETKRGWRAVLHAFFQFCVGDDEADPPIPQVIQINPLAKKQMKKRKNKTGHGAKIPVIMSPDVVERFMHKSEELCPESCAAFAVLFFAGLRPGELGGQYGIENAAVAKAKKELEPYTFALKKAQEAKRKAIGTPGWAKAEENRERAENARKPYAEALRLARETAKNNRRLRCEQEVDRLRWEDIEFGNNRIHVRPETSKMSAHRFVDISANLLAWLMKYRKPSGYVALAPATLRRHRQKVMKAVHISHWKQDVTRHSFVSYHLGLYENIAKTQIEVGHIGDASVLFTHYRDLVSKEAGERYFGIVPKNYALPKLDMKAATATA